MIINSKYGDINFVEPVYRCELGDRSHSKSQKFKLEKKQSEKKSNLKFEELLIQKINLTKTR